MPPTSTPETSIAPLADFFWIAGVDGSEILDAFLKLGEEYSHLHRNASGPSLAETIEEDADAEAENASVILADSSRPDSRNGRRNSVQRLSKLSMSMRSTGSDSKGTHSNRSSMTIKGASSPSRSSFLSDFDFDKALLKFASERESFLSDLSLSAGAITPARPKPRPRTQRITSEEPAPQVNPLKSGIGSVRRHMSFRDMSSMKRQPSVARQGELLLRLYPLPYPFAYSISSHSIHSNIETPEQLQFGDPCSTAFRNFADDAPSETKIRARPS